MRYRGVAGASPPACHRDRVGLQNNISESEMEFTPSVSEWLPLLGRVRFLIITFLLVVFVAVRQWTTDLVSRRNAVHPRGHCGTPWRQSL